MERKCETRMPMIGFGTYKIREPDCAQSVQWALEAGYRHIDTAAVYRNESFVADGIEKSGVPREEIFLATKLGPKDVVDEETIVSAANASLRRLRTDYVDLYLCHWPGGGGRRSESEENAAARITMWRTFQKLQADGKCREIGVSNFTVGHLEHLIEATGVVPSVNQVEFHPFLCQSALLKFCRTHNIRLEAYASLGTGDSRLLQHESVTQIARRHEKTSAQVLLRWAIDQGVAVIPKSVHKERILENFDVFDFKLSDKEIEELHKLDCGRHYCWNPDSVR